MICKTYRWARYHSVGYLPYRPLFECQLAAIPQTLQHDACRVLALKLLCEIRLDKEDLRAVVEAAMKPQKPPSRPPSAKSTRSGAHSKGRAEAVQELLLELQHEPLGEDSEGTTWWYLDLGPAHQTGPSGASLHLAPGDFTSMNAIFMPEYQHHLSVDACATTHLD